MTKKKRVSVEKIGQVKLTDEERALIAANVDSPFYKLLVKKILPSRVQQIALTCVSASQNGEDLWYYKGMVYEADWLIKYISNEIENVDDTDFSNDDDTIGADDDDPSQD